METKIPRRILITVILAFMMSGCKEYDNVRERKFSPDGQYWADFGVRFTGSLQHDIEGITIGKTKPRWIDEVLRKKSEEICELQGHGQLTMTWTDAKHLEVVCSQCDRDAFYPSSNSWEGISVTYIYNGKAVPKNTF